MAELRNRVVVITGASSGFGKGVAEKFTRSGAHVVLAARRKNVLEKLAKSCARRGVGVLAVETDVSHRPDVERLEEEALRAFGRIDVWINNAGVATYGRFDEIPIAEHEQVIRTNLLGCLYGSHIALKQFRLQGHGTLINVGSFAGVQAAPYFASYCASKFGVRGLDMSLRQELEANHERNVHVCTVMPTSMDTPFFQHAANHTGKPVAPIPPVYDPQEVIDAIYEVALNPKDEVIVGSRGKVGRAVRRVAPRLMEHQMATRSHKAYMEREGTAPETSGNLFDEVDFGNDVRGGWRKGSTAGSVIKTAAVLGIPALIAFALRGNIWRGQQSQGRTRAA
ncbi:MAG: short chain dehydrogenase [Candidatus Angelobacter sp. Gp1-AA117]|nr:MAG: short chain dehydrogenase [Candidatus Angelobacter sp. Gp1-AA117]